MYLGVVVLGIVAGTGSRRRSSSSATSRSLGEGGDVYVYDADTNKSTNK